MGLVVLHGTTERTSVTTSAPPMKPEESLTGDTGLTLKTSISDPETVASSPLASSAIQHDCGFLRIPVEVRLEIYTKLLTSPEYITLAPVFPDNAKQHDPAIQLFLGKLPMHPDHALHPAILRVNKTIHREAIPLLYSTNNFRFLDAIENTLEPNSQRNNNNPAHKKGMRAYPVAASFFRLIGPAHASLMRHIMINLPAYDNVRSKKWCTAIDEIKSSCPNLGVLEIMSVSYNIMVRDEEKDIRSFLLDNDKYNTRRYLGERFHEGIGTETEIRFIMLKGTSTPSALCVPSEWLDVNELVAVTFPELEHTVSPGTQLRIPGWTWVFWDFVGGDDARARSIQRGQHEEFLFCSEWVKFFYGLGSGGQGSAG